MKQFIEVLEMVAVASFALGGAAKAIAKRLDAFGVLFIGVVSAFGGGIIRDIVLDNLPPVMFSDYRYVAMAVFSSLILFVIARILHGKYGENVRFLSKVNNILDAVGLGLFTVLGMNTALNLGYSDSVLLLLFVGAVTGVGGGMLRDTMLGEIPSVLTKHVYVLASLTGAVLFLVLYHFGVPEVFQTLVPSAVVVLLRILATYYKWNLPKAY